MFKIYLRVIAFLAPEKWLAGTRRPAPDSQALAFRAASTLTVVAIFALGAQLNGKGEVSVGAIVSFVGFAMMCASAIHTRARTKCLPLRAPRKRTILSW